MAENKTPFSFKDQLKVGDKGEKIFFDNYPADLMLYSGREYDFVCKESKKKIEVKTDTYNMDKTVNFFFERYSDLNKETPGGPWRAKQDKVDTFCYLFLKNNMCFEFPDVKKLVNRLKILTKKKGLVYIKNTAWTTAGYKIKREDVKDLYIKWDWSDK